MTSAHPLAPVRGSGDTQKGAVFRPWFAARQSKLLIREHERRYAPGFRPPWDTCLRTIWIVDSTLGQSSITCR